MLHVVDDEFAADELQHLPNAGCEKLKHHRAQQRLAAHGSLAQRSTCHFDPPSFDVRGVIAWRTCVQCAPRNVRACGAESPIRLKMSPITPNPTALYRGKTTT